MGSTVVRPYSGTGLLQSTLDQVVLVGQVPVPAGGSLVLAPTDYTPAGGDRTGAAYSRQLAPVR